MDVYQCGPFLQGNARGEILTFTHIPPGAGDGRGDGYKFAIGRTLSAEKHKGFPISDLYSPNEEREERFVSADESGQICLWNRTDMTVACAKRKDE